MSRQPRTRFRGRGLLALCVLCALAVLCLGWPKAVSAQQPIRVLDNGHSVTFGREMRFSLALEGSAPITSIVLAYRTSDTQGTTVEPIAFPPDKKPGVVHVHDIGELYVRPFVLVSYWWTVVDLMGARLVTEPQQFLYTDDRFRWETVSQGGVNLHWYQGDDQVAQQALEATLAGLAAAGQALGEGEAVADAGRAGAAVEVYLYASPQDLAPSLPPGTPPDVEALTLHEVNVVLTSFGPETRYIPDLQRVLAHEAAHVYLRALTPGGTVPLWLNEGFATGVQQAVAPDPDARTLLEQSAREGTLLSLLGLCASFPLDPSEARLAYAQSASVTDLIQDRYGPRRLRQLFVAYADGATCEGGVYRVLGVSLEGLEAQWRASLVPATPSGAEWATFWERNGAYLVLLAVLALPTLFVLIASWRRAARAAAP
jgi:hypothetical protein